MTPRNGTFVALADAATGTGAVRWATEEADWHEADVLVIALLVPRARVRTGRPRLQSPTAPAVGAARTTADWLRAAVREAQGRSGVTVRGVLARSGTPLVRLVRDPDLDVRAVAVDAAGTALTRRAADLLAAGVRCPVVLTSSNGPFPRVGVSVVDQGWGGSVALEVASREAVRHREPLTVVRAYRSVLRDGARAPQGLAGARRGWIQEQEAAWHRVDLVARTADLQSTVPELRVDWALVETDSLATAVAGLRAAGRLVLVPLPAEPAAVVVDQLMRLWRGATGPDLVLVPSVRSSLVVLGARSQAVWRL